MENKDMNSDVNDNENKVNTICSLASCFFSIPPPQYAILSSLLGIFLTENLDLDQQNSLGNFLVSVGSSILASAAQGQLIENNSKKISDCN